jgi:hypothetical protein
VKRLLSIIGLSSLILSMPAWASDSPFGYVYTTDTHPQGQWEIEQSVTQLHGKSQGEYDAYRMRTELEYGITNDLQGGLYLNYNTVTADRNNVDGTTGGRFVPASADPQARYSSTFFDSVSGEVIYRLVSPYLHPVGVAFYVEPTYGAKHQELETKALFQMNFLDDQLVLAANIVAALEHQKYSGDWDKETELEFTTGAAYRFAQHWQAGLEFRNQRGYEGYGFSTPGYSAFFLGPTLHYAEQKWWATLSYLPQLKGARGYTDEQRAAIVDGRIYGDEQEKYEVRLKLGWVF